MAETLIFVAFYQHAYGTEVFVYPSEAEARAQRDAIARENWPGAFPREPMPEQVGEVYFERLRAVGNEVEVSAIHPTWCDLARFATGGGGALTAP